LSGAIFVADASIFNIANNSLYARADESGMRNATCSLAICAVGALTNNLLLYLIPLQNVQGRSVSLTRAQRHAYKYITRTPE